MKLEDFIFKALVRSTTSNKVSYGLLFGVMENSIGEIIGVVDWQTGKFKGEQIATHFSNMELVNPRPFIPYGHNKVNTVQAPYSRSKRL